MDSLKEIHMASSEGRKILEILLQYPNSVPMPAFPTL